AEFGPSTCGALPQSPPGGLTHEAGSSQADRLKGISMMDRRLLRKAAKHHTVHAAWGGCNLRRHRADRDAGGTVGRKTIDAGRDRRIGDRSKAVLGRQPKRRAIARGEQLVLSLAAAAPHRADCVDHMPGLELIAAGDLGRAGVAAAERLAFL